MADLEFIIEGKRGKLADFADVSSFCETLNECLRRTYRSLHPRVSQYPRFEIAKLAIGSAMHGIIGDEETIQAIKDLIPRIRNRESLNVSLRTDDLRKFRSLADPLESHTKSISFAATPIDEIYRASCDYLLAKSPRSIGSVIGRLDGINVHKRRFFRLYPEGQDRGVECNFAEELYEIVHGLMRKRVIVHGLIIRDPDGVGIDQIANVTSVRHIPESADLPSFQSLFGIMSGEKSSAADRASGWE